MKYDEITYKRDLLGWGDQFPHDFSSFWVPEKVFVWNYGQLHLEME